MNELEQREKLLEFIAKITIAHQNVANAESGSLEKIEAIGKRSDLMAELYNFSTSNINADVAAQANTIYTNFNTIMDEYAILNIIGAGNAFDGLEDAFNNAADRAEKVEILTQKWTNTANAIANTAETVSTQAKGAYNNIKTELGSLKQKIKDLIQTSLN